MTYARDPYDTDEPPCFCDRLAGPVRTTRGVLPGSRRPGQARARAARRRHASPGPHSRLQLLRACLLRCPETMSTCAAMTTA